MTVVTRVPFNPNNHKIIAMGIPVIGYSGANYLEIKPNAQLANSDVGADGEVHTNLVANNTATATLKMSYDNPTYDLLRAAVVLFQTTGVMLPFSSVNIDRPQDTTFSATSYPINQSTDTYSMNASDMYRTYEFYLTNAIRV